MHLMLLDDGETYSGLYGCRILQVPDKSDPDRIEEILAGIREGDKALQEKHVVTEFE